MSKQTCIAWHADEFVAKRVREAKQKAITEFAERMKHCVFDRDDTTIEQIKKNMLEELK